MTMKIAKRWHVMAGSARTAESREIFTYIFPLLPDRTIDLSTLFTACYR